MFKFNPNPYVKKPSVLQEDVDALAEMTLKDKKPTRQEMFKIIRGYHDSMPGGKADKKDPMDFDLDELMMGVEDEMSDHTKSPYVALEIAMDHLTIDPKFYTNAAACEKQQKADSAEAEKDGEQ